MEENQRETDAQLTELKNIRILLEEARVHARNVGNHEGEAIAHILRVALRKTNRQIHDLRAAQR